MNTRIRAQELQRLLAIGSTSRSWTLPAIKACRIGESVNYNRHLIDTFLADCEHNLPEPPTIDSLAKGIVVLVPSTDAQAQLRVSRTHINTLCDNGRLHYIRIPGARGFRIVQATITANKLTTALVSRILDLSNSNVRQMLMRGELERPADNPRLITEASLRRCLLSRLPPWLKPRDWIKRRLTTNETLISWADVERQLGGRKQVIEAVKDKNVWYIHVRRKSYAFSPSSVAEFVMSQPPLELDTVAKLYDEPLTTVQEWQKHGLLECIIHNHCGQKGIRKSCVLALLNRCLGHNVNTASWYDRQLDNPRPLRSFQKALNYLGLGQQELAALVDDKKVGHVLLPDNSIKFTFNQLAAYKTNHLAKR